MPDFFSLPLDSRLRDLLRSGPVEALDRHGLLGLAASASHPGTQALARTEARRALTLASELVRVSDSFRQAGVPFLSLKGPTLSVLLHGDPGLRSSRDLDLVVRAGDAPAAARALESAGYAPFGGAGRFDWYEERTYAHPGRGVHVDLHTALSPRWFPAQMDLDAVWRRRIPLGFWGAVVDTPCPEDYLVYLCLHGARHAWSSLGWVVDVAALVSTPVDIAAAGERAKTAGASRMLALGLALAHRIAGVGPGDAAMAPLAERVLDWLFGPDPPMATPGSAQAIRMNWTLAESWWSGAVYLAAVAAIPTEADLAWVRLPPRLAALYWGVRPLRLLARALARPG